MCAAGPGHGFQPGLFSKARWAMFVSSAVVCVLLQGAGVVDDAARLEIGAVGWLRDFDQAVARSARDAKPVLMLFQEIPG